MAPSAGGGGARLAHTAFCHLSVYTVDQTDCFCEIMAMMVNHGQPLFLGITGYSTELPQMGVQAYSYDDIFTDDHMTKS